MFDYSTMMDEAVEYNGEVTVARLLNYKDFVEQELDEGCSLRYNEPDLAYNYAQHLEEYNRRKNDEYCALSLGDFLMNHKKEDYVNESPSAFSFGFSEDNRNCFDESLVDKYLSKGIGVGYNGTCIVLIYPMVVEPVEVLTYEGLYHLPDKWKETGYAEGFACVLIRPQRNGYRIRLLDETGNRIYTYHSISHTECLGEFENETELPDNLLDADADTILDFYKALERRYRTVNATSIGTSGSLGAMFEEDCPTDWIDIEWEPVEEWGSTPQNDEDDDDDEDDDNDEDDNNEES